MRKVHRKSASCFVLCLLLTMAGTASLWRVDANEAPAVQVSQEQIARGKKVFRACTLCHSTKKGARHKLGPNLYGIVNAPVASVPGFKAYSDALAGIGGTWTPERLSAYLASPSDEVPGTTMVYVGIRDLDDLAAVIGYLASLDDGK